VFPAFTTATSSAESVALIGLTPNPIVASVNQPSDQSDSDRLSLARNLGRFFGHVKRGFTAPAQPERRTVETRRETTEEPCDTPRGRVTLRRTVIEEVDLPHPPAGPRSDAEPRDDPAAGEDHARSRDR